MGTNGAQGLSMVPRGDSEAGGRMLASSEENDFLDQLKEARSLLSGAARNEDVSKQRSDRYCTPYDAKAADKATGKDAAGRKGAESLLGPGL